MPCNCRQRRENITKTIASAKKRDMAGVRQQASQFARSSVQDIRRIAQGAARYGQVLRRGQ